MNEISVEVYLLKNCGIFADVSIFGNANTSFCKSKLKNLFHELSKKVDPSSEIWRIFQVDAQIVWTYSILNTTVFYDLQKNTFL